MRISSCLVRAVVLVVAAVIAVVVLAIQAATRPAFPAASPPMQMGSTPPAARETPLRTSSPRRFASGEITAEEYQRAARPPRLSGGKT